MQTQLITINTVQTYQLDPKDLKYLQFYSNIILGIESPADLNMTTHWSLKYQKQDFRNYLDQLFSKFRDKICSQKQQIDSLSQQKQYYSQFVKYKDYFAIFSILDNQNSSFLPQSLKKQYFTHSLQQDQFLKDLDQKCRQILWKIDTMKMPIIAKVTKDLQKLQTKNKKIEVYESILQQINSPEQFQQHIKMLANISLVDKNVMESLAKLFQYEKTDWEQKINFYEQLNGHFMVAICELSNYLRGKSSITTVQKAILESTKTIEQKYQNYKKKLLIASKPIIYYIESIRNVESNRHQLGTENNKKQDNSEINWKQIFKQSMGSFLQSVEANFSRQSLIKLNQKLKSFGKASESITTLSQKLSKYCQKQQAHELFKSTVFQINRKKSWSLFWKNENTFNVQNASCAFDILQSLDCSSQQQAQLRRRLETQIVYVLLLEWSKQIQLNKKLSYLSIIETNENYVQIKKLKGVQTLNDFFSLKQSLTNSLQRSKQLVQQILIQQFGYQLQYKNFGSTTKGHLIQNNLLSSIMTLNKQIKKKNNKIQNFLSSVSDWVDQLMIDLGNLIKKNRHGNLSNITPMLQVPEEKFKKFILKAKQGITTIKNTFKPTKHKSLSDKTKLSNISLIQKQVSIEYGVKRVDESDLNQMVKELKNKNIELQKEKYDIQRKMSKIVGDWNIQKDEMVEISQQNSILMQENQIKKIILNKKGIDIQRLIFEYKMRQTREKKLNQLITQDGKQATTVGGIHEQQSQQRSQMEAFVWVLEKILSKYKEVKNNEKQYQIQNYGQWNPKSKIKRQEQQVYNKSNTPFNKLNSLFDNQQLPQILSTIQSLPQKAQNIMWQFSIFQNFFKLGPNNPNNNQPNPRKESGEFQVVELLQDLTPQREKSNDSNTQFNQQPVQHNKLENHSSSSYFPQKNQQLKDKSKIQNPSPEQQKHQQQKITVQINELNEINQKNYLFRQTIINQDQQINNLKDLNQKLTQDIHQKQQKQQKLTNQVGQSKKHQSTQTHSIIQTHQSIQTDQSKINLIGTDQPVQTHEPTFDQIQTNQLALKEKAQSIIYLQTHIENIKIQNQQQIKSILQQHNLEILQRDLYINQLKSSIAQIETKLSEKLLVPENFGNNYTERQARLRQVQRQKDELRRNLRKSKEQARQNQIKLHKTIKEKDLAHLRQLKEKHQQINRLKFQIDTLNRKLNSVTNNSVTNHSSQERPSQNNQLSSRQKLEFNKIKIELEQQRNLSQYLSDKIQSQSQKNKLKIKQLEDLISQSQNTINQLTKEITTLKQFVNQSSNKKQAKSPESLKASLVVFDRYFMGQILEDQYDKKYQLYNLIQEKNKRVIQKTRLLYKFDKINPASFHNYIDGINNIVLIVQSKKNIFGAFSTSKIQSKYREPQNTTAFMFSFYLPGQISYFNYSGKKETSKSLTYDEYFLIVGNSQIRLKSGESIVYSNFGINNGYYDTKGVNVEAILMAENQRQDDLVSYECFEVVFEQDQF